MFGGFDGSFYNDLNICDFSRPAKQVITIEPSTIDADYKSLVNSQESADIIFTSTILQGLKFMVTKPSSFSEPLRRNS
jgi:hypothetical protein